MKQPIVIHNEEDYDQAQARVKELEASGPGTEGEKELQALAEAMLAWEMRLDSASED